MSIINDIPDIKSDEKYDKSRSLSITDLNHQNSNNNNLATIATSSTLNIENNKEIDCCLPSSSPSDDSTLPSATAVTSNITPKVCVTQSVIRVIKKEIREIRKNYDSLKVFDKLSFKN